jgi:hypothetical protein
MVVCMNTAKCQFCDGVIDDGGRNGRWVNLRGDGVCTYAPQNFTERNHVAKDGSIESHS